MAAAAMHRKREQSVLNLYETHASAEVAIEAFHHAGLEMRHDAPPIASCLRI
jgi:hypothetical protein